MNEYEFILEDRITKIKAINEQYDLEHNAYIAFSGGKDSCVLSHLIDLALPNNTIPRVYINTGIEYVDMVRFVRNKAKNDDRIFIINNKLNIKKTLIEKGYPFKSKEHSRKVATFYNNQDSVLEMVAELRTKSLDEINDEFEKKWHYKRAIDIALMMTGLTYNKKIKKVQPRNPMRLTPKILKYQFTKKLNALDFKISDKCCLEFKEKPMADYAKESGRMIAVTGLRRDEKGRRSSTLCTTFNKKTGDLKSFAPLAIITSEWENEFIEREY